MAKHVITKDNSLYALLYGTFGAALSLEAASMTAQKVATRATKPPAYLPGKSTSPIWTRLGGRSRVVLDQGRAPTPRLLRKPHHARLEGSPPLKPPGFSTHTAPLHSPKVEPQVSVPRRVSLALSRCGKSTFGLFEGCLQIESEEA